MGKKQSGDGEKNITIETMKKYAKDIQSLKETIYRTGVKKFEVTSELRDYLDSEKFSNVLDKRYYKVYVKADILSQVINGIYDDYKISLHSDDTYFNRLTYRMGAYWNIYPVYAYNDKYSMTVCFVGELGRRDKCGDKYFPSFLANKLACRYNLPVYVEFCDDMSPADKRFIEVYKKTSDLIEDNLYELVTFAEAHQFFDDCYGFSVDHACDVAGTFLKGLQEGEVNLDVYDTPFELLGQELIDYTKGYKEFYERYSLYCKDSSCNDYNRRWIQPVYEEKLSYKAAGVIEDIIHGIEESKREQIRREEIRFRREAMKREQESVHRRIPIPVVKVEPEPQENGVMSFDREECQAGKIMSNFAIGELLFNTGIDEVDNNRLISTCTALFASNKLAVWPQKIYEEDGKAVITFVLRKGDHPDSRQHSRISGPVNIKDLKTIGSVFDCGIRAQNINVGISEELHFDIGYDFFDANEWESKFYTFEDMAPCDLFQSTLDVEENSTSYLEDLDKLVGLEKEKAQVLELIEYAKKQKANNEQISNMHMCFMGNPGTGKTTLARIVAKAIKQEEIYGVGGAFTEVDRSSLIHRYVGFTESLVKNSLRASLGSVFFIDEFYALSGNREEGHDFGLNALDVINKFMEDNSNRFCLIAAGYTDEMDNALAANPGLRDRFTNYIYFEDYTEDELYQVLVKMLSNKDLELDDEASEVLQEYLELIVRNKDKNFGNARLMRDLAEAIRRKQFILGKETNIVDVQTIETIFNTEDKFIKLTEHNTRVKVGF